MNTFIISIGSNISHSGNIYQSVLNDNKKSAISDFDKLLSRNDNNAGYASLATEDGVLIREYDSSRGGIQSSQLLSVGGLEFSGSTRAEIILKVREYLNEYDISLGDTQIERDFKYFDSLERNDTLTFDFLIVLNNALPKKLKCDMPTLERLIRKLR